MLQQQNKEIDVNFDDQNELMTFWCKHVAKNALLISGKKIIIIPLNELESRVSPQSRYNRVFISPINPPNIFRVLKKVFLLTLFSGGSADANQCADKFLCQVLSEGMENVSTSQNSLRSFLWKKLRYVYVLKREKLLGSKWLTYLLRFTELE